MAYSKRDDYSKVLKDKVLKIGEFNPATLHFRGKSL